MLQLTVMLMCICITLYYSLSPDRLVYLSRLPIFISKIIHFCITNISFSEMDIFSGGLQLQPQPQDFTSVCVHTYFFSCLSLSSLSPHFSYFSLSSYVSSTPSSSFPSINHPILSIIKSFYPSYILIFLCGLMACLQPPALSPLIHILLLRFRHKHNIPTPSSPFYFFVLLFCYSFWLTK